jgi:hypothetical protein
MGHQIADGMALVPEVANTASVVDSQNSHILILITFLIAVTFSIPCGYDIIDDRINCKPLTMSFSSLLFTPFLAQDAHMAQSVITTVAPDVGILPPALTREP